MSNEESTKNGSVDGAEAARRAGLRYVSDQDPAIHRRRCGRGFTYVDRAGKTVRPGAVRERIEALVIPPAWEEVWICAHADGHIQATGRDEDGRKQYLYHPSWRALRDRDKYDRLVALGARLPSLRRGVRRQLDADGVERGRVVAGAVRILDRAALRVGNEVYAEEHDSFGLTTLRKEHVTLSRDRLRLRFDAKGGIARDVRLRDAALARLVRALRRVEGDILFAFRNGAEDGGPTQLRPEHVNDYLREATESQVTAKDFRTWAATVEALRVLAKALDAEPEGRSAIMLAAVDAAAAHLGNLRATARQSYVHPGLLASYEEGTLGDRIAAAIAQVDAPPSGYREAERLLLGLLPLLDVPDAEEG